LVFFITVLIAGCEVIAPPPIDERPIDRNDPNDRFPIDERDYRPIPGPVESNQ
jgi:hypothetical protein